MTELKPCPFHEEAIIPNTITSYDEGNGNPGSGGWCAEIECPRCGNGFSVTECATEVGAMEIAKINWNIRYERTCNPRHTREKWMCDVCGCEIRPGFMPEFHGVGVLRFCPNCGAKVVSA